MLKRIVPLLLATALCLGAAACKKKQTQAEVQAEKKKAFRAEQKNKAATYYQMLATKYPESEYAEKAKQRIQQIGPPTATPAPKKK